MTKVKIKLDDGVELPLYATKGSVGFDLTARSLKKLYKGTMDIDPSLLVRSIENNKHFMLREFERALVGTGVYIELPEGKELQIRPRSGITLKRGLLVSLGTIDSKLNYFPQSCFC